MLNVKEDYLLHATGRKLTPVLCGREDYPGMWREEKIKPACSGLGGLSLCLMGQEEEITLASNRKERLPLHVMGRKGYGCDRWEGKITPALN